jgi:excisionase family DNA binding protein
MTFFKIKEAADRLNVSAATVYELCAKGRLRHMRVGTGRGTIRIDEQALDDFIRGATVQPVEPAAPKPTPVRLKHSKV